MTTGLPFPIKSIRDTDNVITAGTTTDTSGITPDI
jgi:hypothetical protein